MPKAPLTSNISQTLLIFGIIQTLLILGIGGSINLKGGHRKNKPVERDFRTTLWGFPKVYLLGISIPP